MNDGWLPQSLLQTDASMRLFCLPYAGAGAGAYRAWSHEVPRDLQLCPVQLPGRENRIRERPVDDAPTLVRQILDGIRPFLDRPFVIFGHSMGALLGYELARELRRQGLPQPKHLFLAAHRAPHLPGEHPYVHDLTYDKFIAEMRRLEGTPEEVLAHRELMDLVAPILRADFKLCETYSYVPGDPLDIPLSIFGGLTDPKVDERVLAPWREHTTAAMTLRMFAGGHLFLQQERPRLVTSILEDLGIGSVRLTF